MAAYIRSTGTILIDCYISAWQNIDDALSRKHDDRFVQNIVLKALTFIKGLFLLIPILNTVLYTKFVKKRASVVESLLPQPSSLTLTKRQVDVIDLIVTSLATQNTFWLARNRSFLLKEGHLIEDVHPLIFLGYIFQNETYKSTSMPTILNSVFKSKGFINNLSEKFVIERQKGSIDENLPNFLEKLQIKAEHLSEIKEWIENNDIETLLNFLIRY